MLIIFSGLPGTGKTTIAREIARRLGAVYLRVDSIEQALRGCSLRLDDIADAGYAAGMAVAEDNLGQGLLVVADCVNPWPLTREAWRDAARRAGVAFADVEIVCSDEAEHRRRVEGRASDIPGHVLPTWAEVVSRDYRPWESGRIVIDTAGRTAAASAAELLEKIPPLTTP